MYSILYVRTHLSGVVSLTWGIQGYRMSAGDRLFVRSFVVRCQPYTRTIEEGLLAVAPETSPSHV